MKIDGWDLLLLTGCLLIAGGVSLYSMPLGIIVMGVECVVISVIGARTPAPRSPRQGV